MMNEWQHSSCYANIESIFFCTIGSNNFTFNHSDQNWAQYFDSGIIYLSCQEVSVCACVLVICVGCQLFVVKVAVNTLTSD